MAGRLEDIESAEEVGEEVAAGVGEGGDHGDLAGQVANEIKRAMLAEGLPYPRLLSQVLDCAGQLAFPSLGAQPVEVGRCALAQEGVNERDLPALPEEVDGHIGAEEATAAGDEDSFHGECRGARGEARGY